MARPIILRNYFYFVVLSVFLLAVHFSMTPVVKVQRTRGSIQDRQRRNTTSMSHHVLVGGQRQRRYKEHQTRDTSKPNTIGVKPNTIGVQPITCPNWSFNNSNLKKVRTMITRKHGEMAETPILTLFTTLKNVEHRMAAHNNTLRNWAGYWPRILPLLFNDRTDTKLIDLAKSLSWEVLPIPEVNGLGTPKLKPMFMTAARHFKSTFYGYSNGDIVFDKGLVETLELLEQLLPALGQTMLVGCRHDLPFKSIALVNSSDIQRNIKLAQIPKEWAEDYFIIANNSFPWKQVPNDIVIGRPGYDNFMVAIGNMNNVSVVDGSCSVGALHQMGFEGTKAADLHKDRNQNYIIIPRYFPYNNGRLQKTPYQTKTSDNGRLELYKRIFKTNDTLPRFAHKPISYNLQ